MYAYIKGKLTQKQPTHVYLENQGIGYHIHITLNTFSKIEHLEEVRLNLALIVKEDSHTLFGFFSEEEKDLFLLLLSVSGVGSNTARIILSTMTPEEVVHAIAIDNPDMFKKVKGVGPKTAKQIILDLKNKISKNADALPEINMNSYNTHFDEALSALVALGFIKQKASTVLQKLKSDRPDLETTEQVIRVALTMLA
jgi:holliday junction DNA helicase RuvA